MIKLYTHTDLDGEGCAILARMAFGTGVVIEHCEYDDINAKVSKLIDEYHSEIEDVHITDISVSNEVAAKIDEFECDCLLLDHHATALDLNMYDWCKVIVTDEVTGIKTCGTELYYRWLVGKGYLEDSSALRDFVKIIRDYDTWRWVEEVDGIISKNVNDLYYMYDKEHFEKWCITSINDGTFPRFTENDEILLRMNQKQIEDYIEHKNKRLITKRINGRLCGIVFAEKYFSELGNRLCAMHPELDYIVMIDTDGYVSYRSIKDDINLGKDVAALYGGGGHPKAAGSQFDMSVIEKFIDLIFGV